MSALTGSLSHYSNDSSIDDSLLDLYPISLHSFGKLENLRQMKGYRKSPAIMNAPTLWVFFSIWHWNLGIGRPPPFQKFMCLSPPFLILVIADIAIKTTGQKFDFFAKPTIPLPKLAPRINVF